MKKNKSGFTLIELLAVIVILAVILVIAVPRILDVIETSKKDSFKNAAQLIADSAEKKYLENKLNNNDEEITCDNSVKLSKEDYVSCKITFDNEGNAKVNIIGKGKFDGLAVIDGTKMSSEIVELELPEYGLMKTYIENLYNNETLRKANDLKKDNTPDQNIRYYGSNPNNYVSFNNELWRIIGIFGNNVKLVRKDSLGGLSWDSSDLSVNDGMGVNQWGESTYEDGSYYEGADLMQYLNKMYYGGRSVTCYNWKNKKEVTCPTNKLDNTSKALIDNYTWNLGGVISEQDTVAVYNDERGNVTGKICSSGILCNDTIKRTTTWTGYVALPYATDWAYASSENICETNLEAESSNNYICKNNNWMHKNKDYWTLSIFPWEEISNNILVIYVGKYNGGQAARPRQIFPSIYLKSNVLIESGNGSESNPYMLKLNS